MSRFMLRAITRWGWGAAAPVPEFLTPAAQYLTQKHEVEGIRLHNPAKLSCLNPK